MDYHPATGATEGQTAPYDSNVLEISRFSQNPFLALFKFGEFIARMIPHKVCPCPMTL